MTREENAELRGDTQENTASDDDALRKKLLSRIAVAGVTIVGLLGSLAVYDALNKPEVPALPKMAEASREETKPVEAPQPAEAKPDEKPADAQVAGTTPVPERSEMPLSQTPGPAEKPLKPAKPVTPPASARQTAIKPAEPVTAPAAPVTRPDARREVARVMPADSRPAARVPSAAAPSAANESSSIAHAPPSRPLTQAAETARRFLVQVGVFSNPANAEELAQKLNDAGIPARIESHVQVGPFASKAEVEIARAKLKAMGIDDGLLVRR